MQCMIRLYSYKIITIINKQIRQIVMDVLGLYGENDETH